MKFAVCFTFGNPEHFVSFNNVEFPDCISVEEVRSWLNNAGRFVSLKDHLVNLGMVTHIHITKEQQ